MTIQDTTAKAVHAVKQHSPIILTSVGVAGLGATAYLSGRAGFRSGMQIGESVSEQIIRGTPDAEVIIPTPKEIVQRTWKNYIPTAVVIAATAASIIGSGAISNRRNIAFVGAAAIAQRTLSEYREKMIDVVGPNKELKARDEIVQDRVEARKKDFDDLVIVGNGDVLCIDTYSGRPFVSNAEKINAAVNDLNRQCINQDYASMNEFYGYLGMPNIPAGDAVGFNNQHILEVTIGGAVHEGKPVLSVNYRHAPKVGYDSVW